MKIDIYILAEYLEVTKDKSIICFDIKLVTSSSSYSWKLGDCFSSGNYVGKGVYTDRCCLRVGVHAFTCKTSDRSGWAGSALMIGDHRFCDDTVGYKSVSRIDVSGILYTYQCFNWVGFIHYIFELLVFV